MSIRPSLPLFALALTLVGCSSPAEVAERTGVEETARADGAHASASASAGGAVTSVKEETDLYSFGYSYPAAAKAIASLANQLDTDRARHKAELTGEAHLGRTEAAENGFPYHPYSFSKEWKVVADLPDFLSLSGDFSTYSGGAHGMYGLESLVWDKHAQKGITAVDMFASPAALDRALGRKLCEALNAEREKRRGEPVPQVPEGDDLGFNACQHIKDSTVLVGSSNGKTFDRLTVWFGPYVAGPYAEGAFELDFSADKAVLGAVKPEYRQAFSVKR